MGILMLVACNLPLESEASEKEGGGGASNGGNSNGGGALIPTDLAYGMLTPYSGSGYDKSQDQEDCDAKLTDNDVDFIHVQIRNGKGILYEAFKGNDYVFRVVAGNAQDTAEIGYWESDDYENNVGCWGRYVRGEFGYSLGTASMKNSELKVSWEPVHYSEAKIEEYMAQAEKMGWVGRTDEAFELGTEYYRKKDWYQKCEELYDAPNTAELIKAINSRYACKTYEGLVPNDALDLTQYAFDNESMTFKREHENLGHVELTLDDTGRARIIKVSNDAGGWLAMYLEYSGEVPVAPPIPPEPVAPAEPEPVDVSYTKSEVSAAKFAVWDSFANQSYSTKDDASRVGSSNTSIYVDKYENGSNVPEKLIAYRRVTQNMSGSNNGQSDVCDGVSASKSCGILFDANGHVKSGAGYLGLIGPISNSDNPQPDKNGYYVKNNYQIIGLGENDCELEEYLDDWDRTRYYPLYIKESERSKYTLPLDADIETWRKLWRKSTQESGVDENMYGNDYTTYTSEPYFYNYPKGPKKLTYGGEFYHDGVVNADTKAALKASVDKCEEETIRPNLMNGWLCECSNVAKPPRVVDSYILVYLFYDKVDGYGRKYANSSCGNVTKVVTKKGDDVVITWEDSKYREIPEQQALDLIDRYYNGDTCSIDYYFDVVIKRVENFQMWMDERNFDYLNVCKINSGLMRDMKNFCGDWKGDVSNFKISNMGFMQNGFYTNRYARINSTIDNWSDEYNLDINNYTYSNGWYVCKNADYDLKLAFDSDSRLREVQYKPKSNSDAWNMLINYGENVPNWFPRPHSVMAMEEFQ
ncbi:MAG TPA: hypothetical protein DCO86_01815 [Spirochaetaceae bacterium]|nr:hypothetical protein [Spirochaetaceae bacterium]